MSRTATSPWKVVSGGSEQTDGVFTPQCFILSVPHHGRSDIRVVSGGGDTPGGGANTAPPAGAHTQRHGGLHGHLLHRDLHLSQGRLQVQEDVGLLHVSDLHPHLFDRDDVLDQFLDQTWGCTCPGNPGCDLPADSLHPACQQPEVSTSRLLYQGNKQPHPWQKLVLFLFINHRIPPRFNIS